MDCQEYFIDNDMFLPRFVGGGRGRERERERGRKRGRRSRIGRQSKNPKKGVTKTEQSDEDDMDDDDETLPHNEKIRTHDVGHGETKAQIRKRRYERTNKARLSRKRYKDSDQRKASRDRYESSEHAKQTRSIYESSEHAKQTRSIYESSEHAKQTRSRYIKSKERKSTQKSYEQNVKGKARRASHMKNPIVRKITNKYENQRRDKARKERKMETALDEGVSLDFGGEYCNDVTILREHCPSEAIVEKFYERKDMIVNARSSCKSTLTQRTTSAAVRAKLVGLLETAIVEANLTAESVASCGGSKKAEKRTYNVPSTTAARSLANRVYNHRKMCVSNLYNLATRLRDLATGIIATMKLSLTEEQQRLALLGLQSHRRFVVHYIFRIINYH